MDPLLAGDSAAWPPSSRNLLLAQRLRLARTLDEFVQFAPREPASVTVGPPGSTRRPKVACSCLAPIQAPATSITDATWVLNRRMPLTMLAGLAGDERLPPNLRAQIATAALVRALLLERDGTAQVIASDVTSLLPQTRGRLDAFRAAQDTATRGFEAALFLLDFPGAMPSVAPNVGRLTPLDRMDPFRDNWWCAVSWVNEPYPGCSRATCSRRRTGERDSPRRRTRSTEITWLTDAGARRRARRVARAHARRVGPELHLPAVVTWARAHPQDPRVPRALHLAVQATRYGCHDAQTTDLSRQAFRLLHARYPKSEWTKNTPHYYYCPRSAIARRELDRERRVRLPV
jgi:hypothetical protein